MKVFQVIACAILLTSFPVLSTSAAAAPSSRDEISLKGVWDFHPNGGEERHESVSVIAKVLIHENQVGAEDPKGCLMLQLPVEIDITRH